MSRVLSPAERGTARNFRLHRWLKGREYRRKESVYFGALTVFRGATVGRGGDAEPRVMMDLLAIALEDDPSFRGWVERKNRGAARLRTRQGWEDVYQLAAGLVVERYFADQPEVDPTDVSVLTREELRDRVQTLIQTAQQHGQTADAAVVGEPGVSRYTPPENLRPRLADGAGERLERLLREEIILVQPAGTDLGIPRDERDREVAKRALVRLRIGELRQIADREGLPTAGSIDQVAERLAEKYENDEGDIARLIIGQEEELPERGFVSRLLPLRDEPEVARVSARLDRLVGNYVRVATARWFVFTEVRPAADVLIVRGRFRYYRVQPKLEYNNYSLSSQPRETDAEIRVRRDIRWLEVRGSGGDMRSLGLTFDQTAGLRPLDDLPMNLAVPEGPLFSWDRRTVFMLGLLSHELSDDVVTVLNIAMAQFDSGTDTHTANPLRPTVQSVRLQGQQLMSSRQACEMIVAPRALINLQVRIRVALAPGTSVLCPLRIELARDHATLYTGFSVGVDESLTLRVHDLVLERLRRALDRGALGNEARVTALAGQIRARAAEESPDEADILAPPSGDDGQVEAA